MAPEITGEKTYNQKVDIWSLGIIVYQMLHQILPFCPSKDFSQVVFEENRQKVNIVFDS
jgi:calcium/calmodulin-dependent protein kinase I